MLHFLCTVTVFQSDTVRIEVQYTSDAAQCDKWCQQIRQSQVSLIGVDCEWKWNRTKRERNKLAVIQICTDSKCLVLQCIDWDQFPSNLVAILYDVNVMKTGVGIHGDAKVIRRSFGIEMTSYLDTRYLSVLLYERDIFRIPNNCFGLKKMSHYLFGVEMPTSSTRSNWEQKPLSLSQRLYSALDGYYSRNTALLLIYCLQSRRMVHYGTDDIPSILKHIDSVHFTDKLSIICREVAHLLNVPFRQPSWCKPVKPKTEKKKESNRDIGTMDKNGNILEEQWLGLHSEKYAKRRRHLDFWNMYGADGRFVARVKRKRVEWYVQRKLAVIVAGNHGNGNPLETSSPSLWSKRSGQQPPSFQLVFRLKRYQFPGDSAYVMKSCFVCGSSATDGFVNCMFVICSLVIC